MRGRKTVHKSVTSRQCVGYVRVSTEEQARNGVSLAAQEERIRAFAVGTGRVLSDVVIDDGVSAKDLKRVGMQRILTGICAGQIGAVVILKLDRLTRSVSDLMQLIGLFNKHDVALVSISETLDTGTATGRMLMTVIGTISQWEREAIGERTAFALTHLRRTGKVYGRVPFGWYREGDNLVVDPRQQRALTMAQKMFASGASLRQIAAELTNQGVHAAEGGVRWHAASVRSILRSKLSVEAL